MATVYRALVGTAHFRNETAAFKYYSAYGYTRKDVTAKIDAGEISIGAPAFDSYKEELVIDRDGRYLIGTLTAL